MSAANTSKLDPAVSALLDEYSQRAARERAQMEKMSSDEMFARLDEFLLGIGPDTGSLLHSLARSLEAKVIVELGVSYGYSTVWLADAARRTGGKVHSFELSADKVAYAHDKLRGVGLDSYVEFHVGNALERLPELKAPIDLALLDIWKDMYRPCFELLYPSLAPEGVVVADNMLQPTEVRQEALAYQALVRTKGDMDSVLLPIGSGLELSRKRGPQRPV
ncbi:MAG: class I SAM-dependent methyltransferase [Polyangiales bacterium]